MWTALFSLCSHYNHFLVSICTPRSPLTLQDHELLWKRSTDSRSFPARVDRKDSPARPLRASTRMISSVGRETTQWTQTSGNAGGRARCPTLTWIVFSNGDEVEEALAGQQLFHQRQELVGYFSTSNPSGPSSLDASAAHLVKTNNEQNVKKKKHSTEIWLFCGRERLGGGLRYLLGGRDHVRRVKDEDVYLPLEPRQETLHLKETSNMSLITLQRNKEWVGGQVLVSTIRGNTYQSIS